MVVISTEATRIGEIFVPNY